MIIWGLMTFNRPNHTRRVIESLRANQIQPLYIFVDGPRDSSDLPLIFKVQDEIDKIDWTRPTVFVRTENWGLRRSVLGAVDEMFQSHDKIVVIEDDCVLGTWFADYMRSCLDRYQYYNEVMSVSGYTVRLTEPLINSDPWDVYFHPRIGSWGWGTWKRAWEHYQWDLRVGLSKATSQKLDLRNVGMDVPQLIYSQIRNRSDAWTPGWLLGTALRKGLCIYPKISHVRNIGFDGTGVHCGKTQRWGSLMASQPSKVFPHDLFVSERIRIHVNDFYGGTLHSA